MNVLLAWIKPYRFGAIVYEGQTQDKKLNKKLRPLFSEQNQPCFSWDKSVYFVAVNHIIESQQFDQKFITVIFSIADKLRADILRKKTKPLLKGKIMASLFYEPSTRTRFSFESAMRRLGGDVITTENASEFSSASKGETLEDSIRVINAYSDIIVLRHYEEGASRRAAAISKIPIINAGDGPGQHPTQALLDLYTIKKEFGKIDGLTIAFVGDLKHGRTIRSLAYLLGKYKKVHICFVSPSGLRVGMDIKEYLDLHKISYMETDDLGQACKIADVIYQTRIQKERFKSQKEYEKYRGVYQISLKMTNGLKKDAIIMHPLPRVGEILSEVDSSPKARYFEQAENGLYMRMALLAYLLDGK